MLHFRARALRQIALEQEVKHSTGKYCVSDSPTVADACLIPQLYNARRFNCDMTQFPTLLRIESELEKLPAFIAAHPDQQPDAVKTAPTVTTTPTTTSTSSSSSSSTSATK